MSATLSGASLSTKAPPLCTHQSWGRPCTPCRPRVLPSPLFETLPLRAHGANTTHPSNQVPCLLPSHTLSNCPPTGGAVPPHRAHHGEGGYLACEPAPRCQGRVACGALLAAMVPRGSHISHLLGEARGAPLLLNNAGLQPSRVLYVRTASAGCQLDIALLAGNMA